jgi:hypothetical protein
MRRALTIFGAAALAGLLATAAFAQDASGVNRDINQTELANFNRFLNNHPRTAHQLAANPGLINDPKFIASHQGLHQFLEIHHGVREELHESPGRFMYREGHYQWSRGGGTPAPYAAGPRPYRNTGHYFDTHPEVAQQLQHNPKLIDDPKYAKNHPGLHEYLATHPNARRDWKSRAYKFIHRDNLYDQRHGG